MLSMFVMLSRTETKINLFHERDKHFYVILYIQKPYLNNIYFGKADVEETGVSVAPSIGPSSTEETVAFAKAGIRLPYPKSVFFILASECAERFSYYGMRSENTFIFAKI